MSARVVSQTQGLMGIPGTMTSMTEPHREKESFRGEERLSPAVAHFYKTWQVAKTSVVATYLTSC